MDAGSSEPLIAGQRVRSPRGSPFKQTSVVGRSGALAGLGHQGALSSGRIRPTLHDRFAAFLLPPTAQAPVATFL
jgi:hypothetical protein